MKLFKFNNETRVYDNVEHLFNETIATPRAAWANVHGYKFSGKYAVCVDFRFLGIRVHDIILICNSETSYNVWIKKASSDPDLMPLNVSSLPNAMSGSKLKTKFTFNTTDGKSKSYNMTMKLDFYGVVD